MSTCFHIVQTSKVLATRAWVTDTQVRTTFLRKMDGSMMGVHTHHMCPTFLLGTFCQLCRRDHQSRRNRLCNKHRKAPHNNHSNPLCLKGLRSFESPGYNQA